MGQNKNQKIRGHKFWNFLLSNTYICIRTLIFTYARNRCGLNHMCRHFCTPLLFQPDSLLLEWGRVRKSESDCFTASVWRKSRSCVRVVLPWMLATWWGTWRFDRELPLMEHLLSAKCFQRREERLHISSKTEYPFYLGVGNINGMEGESSHYSRMCDTCATPAPTVLFNPQSGPIQQSQFSDEETETHWSNRLSQDHTGS